WPLGRCDVRLPRACGQTELPIGTASFGECPGVTVDAHDLRTLEAFRGPRRSRCTGAAAQIDERPRRGGGTRQCANDVANQEVVQRTVEQGERGALSGAREGGALTQPVPALDVGG